MISLLDQDLYKFFHSQVAFSQFPEVEVRYEFINRGTEIFYDGFDQELQDVVWSMSDVMIADDELNYLRSLGYFTSPYLEWLKNFKYNPGEVDIQWLEGKLSIKIEAEWFRSTLWEIPLMAAISELFFKKNKICVNEAVGKAQTKCMLAQYHHVGFSDFGTRRRYSQFLHECIIERCKEYRDKKHGLLGTSNVYLAYIYGLPAIGTQAHELSMVMQAFSPTKSNVFAMDAWIKQFNGKLGISLPDTLSTDYFLLTFNDYYARVFDGVRQDSGDACIFIDKMVKHYNSLGIDPTSKKFICSDGLNIEKLINLCRMYPKLDITGGVGTFFTNDVGLKPLNIVIKATEANIGDGWVGLVKLGDGVGKETGRLTDIGAARNIIKRKTQC